MVIRLAVASTDTVYLRRFVSALEQNPKLDISVYSDADNLLQEINQRRFDVFLFSSELIADNPKCMDLQADLKILLCDENDSENERRDIKYVKKYQRVSRIYSKILDYYSEVGGRKGIADDTCTQLITFYSPVGGAGKTTLALTTAMKYARQGKRTFYMNLEDMASEDCFLPQDHEKGFSDLMRFLNTNTNFRMKVEGMLKQKTDRLFYINHFSSPNDLFEMTEEELQALVEAVQKTGLFDLIVADMGTELNKKNLALLDLSDRIVVVEKPDEISAQKMKCFYGQHHIMKRLSSKMLCVTNFDRGIAGSVQGNLLRIGKIGDVRDRDSSKIIETLVASEETNFLTAAFRQTS